MNDAARLLKIDKQVARIAIKQHMLCKILTTVHQSNPAKFTI